MDLDVKIKNVTEAQAIALEDMFRTWVQLGNIGGSRWTSFFADGDGNFRPQIEVNGRDAQFAPEELISDKQRAEMWKDGDYRIDFDSIAWRLRESNKK
jgi:hypothetical protein